MSQDHVQKPLCQSGWSKPTGTWRRRQVRRSPPDTRSTTGCPGVWPPVTAHETPGPRLHTCPGRWRAVAVFVVESGGGVSTAGTGVGHDGCEVRRGQKVTSAADTWMRTGASAIDVVDQRPPTWSMCICVMITSVTDSSAMPDSGVAETSPRGSPKLTAQAGVDQNGLLCRCAPSRSRASRRRRAA